MSNSSLEPPNEILAPDTEVEDSNGHKGKILFMFLN